MRNGTWPLVAALTLVAGVTLMPPSPGAEGTTVQMVDNEPDLTNWHFDPKQLTVPAGSTVVWHNRGHEEHSVTADDKSFDSGLKKPGTDFQRAFPRVGQYAYHCAPHPWMTGVIQVVAAPTTTATAAPATTATTPTAPGGEVTTTLPASSATPAPGQSGSPGQSGGPGATTTTAQAGEATTAPPSKASGGSAAGPAGKSSHSRRNLAATLAIVLIPTLGALAVGARVRRSRS